VVLLQQAAESPEKQVKAAAPELQDLTYRLPSGPELDGFVIKTLQPLI